MNLPPQAAGNMTLEIPPGRDQFDFDFSIHFALENLVSLIQILITLTTGKCRDINGNYIILLTK
jgi:hypothetical protein